MAALVLTNCKIQLGTAWTGTAPGAPGTQSISGTISGPSDISAFTTMVEIPKKVDTKEWTNYGSGGYILKTPGLKSASLKIGINQDFASSQIDSIIRGFGLGTLVYYDITPTNAARSATNPSEVGAAYITSYTPIVGKVGDLLVLSLDWDVTGKFDTLTS
jgi:hypothetical protein